jgi:uncharacterized protein YbjT (DUF2867 family)
MSRVLVTGGTGALGSVVVERLRERGDDVRVLSRRPGAGTHVGDLTSGEGVTEAARGAELIIHAASDSQRQGRADLAQTNHLLDAAKDAQHLLYVSIVGIDQIPFSYYKRKLECEQQIAAAGIPYTLFRSTQFHQLIAFLLRGAERLPLAPLPLDFRFQTVAAADVGVRTAEQIHAAPVGGIVNTGGPELLTLREMAETWRTIRGKPRRLVRLPVPGKVGRAFREGRNTYPDRAEGTQTWAEFVASDPPNPYKLRG